MSDLKQQIEQALRKADVLDSDGDEMVGMRNVADVELRIVKAILPIIEATLPPETPPSAETELLLEIERWKGRDELREHRLNAWREVGEEMQRIIAYVDKKDLLPDWFEPRLNQLLRTYGLAALSSPRRVGEAWHEAHEFPEKPGKYLVFDGIDHYVAYWAPAMEHQGPALLHWTAFKFNRIGGAVTHWRELDAPPAAGKAGE